MFSRDKFVRHLTIDTVLIAALLQPASARTLEVEVYGMTCAFCVDSLQRTFSKIPAIKRIRISLEQKKLQLETEKDSPSYDTIRQLILDAGFTPTRIRELPDSAD